MAGLQMTPGANAHSPDDLLREQLSAMMDGALPADESRFLLRRMEHDDDLADTWQRWQLYGDAMRGHAGRLLPADFAARVGRAIADDVAMADAPAARAPGRAWRWGGGAAVAASVALAALLGTRTLAPGPGLDGASAATAATAIPPIPIASDTPPATSSPPVQPPIVLSDAGAAVALAASQADGPRKPRIIAADAAEPLATRRAAAPAVATARVEPEVAAATLPAGLAPSDTADPAARPWPKSLLGDGHGGSMSAGFGAPLLSIDPSLRSPETPVVRFGRPTRGTFPVHGNPAASAEDPADPVESPASATP